jgi:DNA-binding NarL/FixJ family response regulator
MSDSLATTIGESLGKEALSDAGGVALGQILVPAGADFSGQAEMSRKLDQILAELADLRSAVDRLTADIEDEQEDHQSAINGNKAPVEPVVLLDSSNTRTAELSPREKCILRWLLLGDSNKVIARKIDIAEATVKVHIKAILCKIRAQNRTQAAIWAMNNTILG